MKFIENHILKVVLVIILLILICVIVSNIHFDDNETSLHVQALVSERVKNDLGEGYSVAMVKYNHKNQMYSIGFINPDNTHAVIYIARPNAAGTTWIINKLSSQTGSNASSLFSTRRNIQF